MSLVLALKNRNSIIAASDSPTPTDGSLAFGQFMNVPGRAILLLAGNLAAVQRPIVETVLPKLTASTSAATLAQLIQAALVLEVVPHLAGMAGRVEIIVAGIDPVRHTEEPGLYYLDSAQDFYLQPILGQFVAAGANAAVAEVIGDQDLTAATDDDLINLAKECITTTKLRWPTSVAQHVQFGVISPVRTRILNF
ncbi:MAG TPA: hypothetical protein VMT30_07195 [Candidatus Saccharimonadia bacterium]|nr:hypothetical protein [Candidatus Saccharimonadia bacterium]